MTTCPSISGRGMCFFFILPIFFHFPFPSHYLLYIRHLLS